MNQKPRAIAKYTTENEKHCCISGVTGKPHGWAYAIEIMFNVLYLHVCTHVTTCIINDFFLYKPYAHTSAPLVVAIGDSNEPSCDQTPK